MTLKIKFYKQEKGELQVPKSGKNLTQEEIQKKNETM